MRVGSDFRISLPDIPRSDDDDRVRRCAVWFGRGNWNKMQLPLPFSRQMFGSFSALLLLKVFSLIQLVNHLQSGAAGCVKGFVTCFLEVPLALLGQHGSYSSAQLPVELSENVLQNLFLNLPPQTV